MLRTNIQASAITNLTDARYFAAREVKWLCFDLDNGSISAAAVAAIKEWVDGVEIVGAFSARSMEDIRNTAIDLHLDFVQLDTFYDVNSAAMLSDFKLIKQVVVDSSDSWDIYDDLFHTFQAFASYFMLDLDKEGLHWTDLTPHQKEKIRAWCSNYKIVLSLPFEKSDLEEILALQPYGINLKGGDEEKVGFKSYDDLDDILDELMIEE